MLPQHTIMEDGFAAILHHTECFYYKVMKFIGLSWNVIGIITHSTQEFNSQGSFKSLPGGLELTLTQTLLFWMTFHTNFVEKMTFLIILKIPVFSLLTIILNYSYFHTAVTHPFNDNYNPFQRQLLMLLTTVTHAFNDSYSSFYQELFLLSASNL